MSLVKIFVIKNPEKAEDEINLFISSAHIKVIDMFSIAGDVDTFPKVVVHWEKI